MLAAATTVKLIAEIALLAMMGQWAVGLMAGAGREGNPVYRLFALMSRPWVRGVRWLAPQRLPDRLVPRLAFVALLLVWVVSAVWKVRVCLQTGMAFCK